MSGSAAFEMSATTRDDAHPASGNPAARDAAATTRRSSTVRFGLRAAVLAGVIAAAGGATVGLGSAINGVSGPMDTTCCAGAPAAVSRIM
ncbi:MAG TPA: hypothetical protein VFU73_00365 [Actinocrinis sp.]|nr:hypothetical protein [Actinocrinis sp.]